MKNAAVGFARLVAMPRRKMTYDGSVLAASGAVGTLSLYANTAAMTHYLPNRLAVWLSERPQMFVDLRERTSAGIIQGVTTGLIEAGSFQTRRPPLAYNCIQFPKIVLCL
ncbi:hypothetical protein [Pseudomonas sp. LS-2]|uniref:hypothetical protein n=1 Tax=Pseudomonas sp. LS-2 TaxID=2315859 RepID=UPI001C49B15B|nr:hypothetical protein [Pseudomonas sp. LS-2]